MRKAKICSDKWRFHLVCSRRYCKRFAPSILQLQCNLVQSCLRKFIYIYINKTTKTNQPTENEPLRVTRSSTSILRASKTGGGTLEPSPRQLVLANCRLPARTETSRKHFGETVRTITKERVQRTDAKHVAPEDPDFFSS